MFNGELWRQWEWFQCKLIMLQDFGRVKETEIWSTAVSNTFKYSMYIYILSIPDKAMLFGSFQKNFLT